MQHQYTQYDCEWHVTSNTPTTNIVNIYLHSVFFNESIAFWNVVDVDRRSMIQVLEHQISQKQWFFTFSWRATFCKHSLTNTFDAILNRIVFNLIYFDRWSCVCVMTNVKTSGGYVQLLLCWWWRFVYRVDGWRLAWTMSIGHWISTKGSSHFLSNDFLLNTAFYLSLLGAWCNVRHQRSETQMKVQHLYLNVPFYWIFLVKKYLQICLNSTPKITNDIDRPSKWRKHSQLVTK